MAIGYILARSRRIECSKANLVHTPKFKAKAGPSNLVNRAAYNTTMAISTLTKLEAKRILRRGDGILTMPACRRRERLFGQTGATGRTSRPSLGVKLEKIYAINEIEVEDDTALEAFIRMIAGHAHADAVAEAAGRRRCDGGVSALG